MSRHDLTPRRPSGVEIETLAFPAANGIPNNEFHPAVLAHGALGGANPDAAVRSLLERNGWGGSWTWHVFDFHHYHPDAFEVLAVASGGARLVLGGPQGIALDIAAGDVILLPPGFGHRQLSMQDDFRICGAYPPGQEDYTVVKAEEGYGEATLAQLAAVPFPDGIRCGAATDGFSRHCAAVPDPPPQDGERDSAVGEPTSFGPGPGFLLSMLGKNAGRAYSLPNIMSYWICRH